MCGYTHRTDNKEQQQRKHEQRKKRKEPTKKITHTLNAHSFACEQKYWMLIEVYHSFRIVHMITLFSALKFCFFPLIFFRSPLIFPSLQSSHWGFCTAIVAVIHIQNPFLSFDLLRTKAKQLWKNFDEYLDYDFIYCCITKRVVRFEMKFIGNHIQKWGSLMPSAAAVAEVPMIMASRKPEPKNKTKPYNFIIIITFAWGTS